MYVYYVYFLFTIVYIHICIYIYIHTYLYLFACEMISDSHFCFRNPNILGSHAAGKDVPSQSSEFAHPDVTYPATMGRFTSQLVAFQEMMAFKRKATCVFFFFLFGHFFGGCWFPCFFAFLPFAFLFFFLSLLLCFFAFLLLCFSASLFFSAVFCFLLLKPK